METCQYRYIHTKTQQSECRIFNSGVPSQGQSVRVLIIKNRCSAPISTKCATRNVAYCMASEKLDLSYTTPRRLLDKINEAQQQARRRCTEPASNIIDYPFCSSCSSLRRIYWRRVLGGMVCSPYMRATTRVRENIRTRNGANKRLWIALKWWLERG